MNWRLPFGKKKLEVLATSRNDAVRQALANHGDNGSAVRHVVHYAYPTEDADLSTRLQMIADLKAQGFKVRDAVAKNGLVFEHHHRVAPGDFDDLTDGLTVWFEKAGWDYDGWECAVVDRKGIN